jgi:hypothetical protein
VSTTGVTGGDILIYNGESGIFIPSDLCTALDSVSIDCLGDISASNPATGAFLVWDGDTWQSTLGETGIGSEGFFGEMVYLGNTGDADGGADSFTWAITGNTTFDTLEGDLSAGLLSSFTFVAGTGAASPDRLVAEFGGTYLITYTLSIASQQSRQYQFGVFLNGQLVDKSLSRSRTPGQTTKVDTKSNSFFLVLARNDTIDFRARFDESSASVKDLVVYHMNVNVSRRQ